VLPESQLYPALGNSLLAGLKLAFAERNNVAGSRRVELLPAFYNDRISGATKQARALITDQDVDLLVGVMSSAAIAPLHELLEARQIPLILTNVGANVVRPRGENPYLFRASLNDWQANWATGGWAAKHIGRRAFVATSFYESGYDTSYLFTRGFERAGGTILGRHVTHLPRQVDSFTPMVAAIKQANPDLVYAAYSGQQARDFMRAYAGADLAGRVPLVGSGFLLDESLLAQHGQAALHAVSGFAWALELDTPENSAFTSAYRAATGRPADPFAVLGYDTGRLIADAVATTTGDTHATGQLLTALRTGQLLSPRGTLTMNQQTQSSAAPIYIREVQQRGGRFSNTVIATVDAMAGLDEAAAIRASLKSGWLDAYLAV
jgi:branched-chain amino acid transport system substrate-binding protein